MGRQKKEDQSMPEKVVEVVEGMFSGDEDELKQISAKQFIAELKKELAESNIPQSAFNAFIAISPRVDTKKNYRNVWQSTFKRK